MRIPSGKTDQNIYFVAQLGGARVTGLSSFTVYRSRNGAAPVLYTTPTTTEIDTTTMPGVYSLLVDEDTTIASGSDSEEMALHITKTGMDPVTRTFELYRRTATTGETIDVASGGVEVGTFQAGAITATAIAADAITDAKVASDVTIASVTGAVGSVTGAVGSVTGAVGSVGAGGITAASFADNAITAAKLDPDVTTELQAGLATAASLSTVAGYLDTEVAAILAAVDTEVGAIKTVTDQITFGTANRVNAQVYGMEANTVTAAAAASDLTTELQSGLATSSALSTLSTAVGVIDDFLDTEMAAVLAAVDTEVATIVTQTSAASIRTAVGLASANLDTQLSTIDDFLDTEITDIRNRLPAALVSGRMDASVGAMAADVLTAAATATDFGTEIGTAVWATTARVLTAGTNIALAKGTGVTGFNDLSAAQVNTEVDTALADVRLDELLAADSDIDGAAPPTVGSVFHELMTKTAGSFTYDQTTDSLEAVRDRGDAAWITAVGFSTLDAVGVRSAVGLASANLDTQLDALPTLLELADEADTAASIWDYLTADATTSGSLGKLVVDNLNATVSSRASQTSVDTIDDFLDTEIAAILADTNELQTDWVNGGRLDLIIDAVLAAITALNNISAAQVNAEMVDALNVDTYAEPGQGSPAATASLVAKLGYLHKAWRNRHTQTASEYALFADDGTTKDQEAAVTDDGTTFTRAEVTTGA